MSSGFWSGAAGGRRDRGPLRAQRARGLAPVRVRHVLLGLEELLQARRLPRGAVAGERGWAHAGVWAVGVGDGLGGGKGVCVYANGARYEGAWDAGVRHGQRTRRPTRGPAERRAHAAAHRDRAVRAARGGLRSDRRDAGDVEAVGGNLRREHALVERCSSCRSIDKRRR